VKVKDLQMGKYYWCRAGAEDTWKIVITLTDDNNVPCIASFLSEKPIPISELEEDLYDFEEVKRILSDAELIESLYAQSFIPKDFDINKAFGFWHFKDVKHCFVGTLEDCAEQYMKARN
jgi:hypothetical protein